MNRYYLMAQLPSLEAVADSMPLPITEEAFAELCERFLGKKTQASLAAMTLSPAKDAEKTGSALLDAWHTRERQLRLALAVVRAEKMHKTVPVTAEEIPPALTEMARDAVSMPDPMAAEVFLYRERLAYLETLRPSDPFSEAAVLYYGLKLKLMTRMRQFDVARGRAAYQTIYTSVLRGAEEEADNG